MHDLIYDYIGEKIKKTGEIEVILVILKNVNFFCFVQSLHKEIVATMLHNRQDFLKIVFEGLLLVQSYRPNRQIYEWIRPIVEMVS